jgi:putative DNA primase/helicase
MTPDSIPNGNGKATPLINLAATRHETVLEAARDYTRGGVRVTPVVGKQPILDQWQDKRLNEDDLPAHFGNGRNVGVLLGEPSGGLVDVDLDVSQAVRAADVLLPETLGYGREKNRRSHRLCVCDPIPQTKKYCLPKTMTRALGFSSEERAMLVELRSTGGQSVFPPSIHPQDKDEYAWDDGHQVRKIEGRDLEDLVREVATATLLSLYCHSGIRQDLFLAAAGYLGRHLDHECVEAILEATAAATGDEEAGKREEAVRDTFEKLENGDPVTGGPTLDDLAPGVPKLLAKWWGWKSNGARRQKQSVPTHDELRDRWLEENPSTAFGLGEWHRSKNGMWVPIGDLAIEQEIAGVLEAAKPEGVRPSASVVESVVRLARAKAAVPDGSWGKADILVCSNGTLEISNLTLREHRPEDYALSSVPYAYDPEATAPTWESYLESTVPGAADFLREFAGYSLTVDTYHEIAVWLYGPPGSGKSTFIESLRAMLGTRSGVLGLADVQRNRFALAGLPGKTLVVASEQPSDFIKSTHIINSIISGEEIPVEKKFKDAFLITPKAKICWAMNDLPRVGHANSGLFRRVKVVTFPKLKKQADPELKTKLKAEGAGILNWALEGLRTLRERGSFEIPACVSEATKEFQKTNDVPALFVEEACIASAEEKVQSSTLYDSYKAWCEINGHKPQSSTSISDEWKRLGYTKKTINGRKFYQGLKLNLAWVYEHGLRWRLQDQKELQLELDHLAETTDEDLMASRTRNW